MNGIRVIHLFNFANRTHICRMMFHADVTFRHAARERTAAEVLQSPLPAERLY